MTPEQLTAHIAAIIENPDTPVGLYNDLHDSIVDLADEHKVNLFHPDLLRVAFPLLLSLERNKDSGTPSPEVASAAAAPSFTRCANLIADLLESEDTPEVFHTLLDGFTNDLSNQLGEGDECACSPATIRLHLPAMLERADRQRLICPNGGVMLEPRRTQEESEGA